MTVAANERTRGNVRYRAVPPQYLLEGLALPRMLYLSPIDAELLCTRFGSQDSGSQELESLEPLVLEISGTPSLATLFLLPAQMARFRIARSHPGAGSLGTPILTGSGHEVFRGWVPQEANLAVRVGCTSATLTNEFGTPDPN